MRDGSEDIFVMNADGSGQTNLTNHPERDAFPAWSPDGTRITFTSRRDGNGEIYLMNVDGSGKINLTNNPADDDQPVWSPDGTRLQFRSFRAGIGVCEIYSMKIDGTDQVKERACQ